MPDPLITLSGHTDSKYYYEDGQIVFYSDVNGDTVRNILVDWLPHPPEGQLLAAAPDLLAIATELTAIARGYGSDDKTINEVWTSRGLAPPATEGAEG